MRLVNALMAMFLLTGLLLTGCTSEKDRARQTVEQFTAASKRGDADAQLALMTQKAQENVRATPGFLDDMHKSDAQKSDTVDKPDTVEYGTPIVNGETAIVPVRSTDRDGQATTGTMRLRKENGEWRIYGVSIAAFPGKPQIEINLENPAGLTAEMFRAMGTGVGQALRGAQEGFGAFLDGMQKGLGERGSAPTPPNFPSPATPPAPPSPPASIEQVPAPTP